MRSSWAWRLDRAADAAVRADRLGHGLGGLVPGARLAHVVLGLEHQRAGRADADAVAAVDARRFGQRDGLLGRDPRVEAAPGDGDREGVLGLLAAGVDALVAEDALRVIADVEVVVDLRRLGDGRGGGVAGGRVVVAGLERVAFAGRCRRRRRAVAGGVRAVALGVGRDRAVRGDRAGQRQVDRRAEELEHHLARQPDAFGVGLDVHPGFDRGASRREPARASRRPRRRTPGRR